MSSPAFATPPVDLSKWSPEYVRSIAGTKDFDTAADCGKVSRSNYKGSLTFWYQGVFEGDPELLRQYYKDFFAAFRKTYPNIELEEQALTYNDLLDKFRTALLGNAAPMVVRLQILGGVEFASKGYIQELKPEDVGYSTEDFWPGAMKSNMWKGKTYGIPTNNETMALIWNADVFKRAGLDPESRRPHGMTSSSIPSRFTTSSGLPATALSRARTPATRRIASCPSSGHMAAARSTKPRRARTIRKIQLNSPASKQALQASYDMYVRDKSVPVSALDQPAGRQPAAVPGRPARHDDLPSVRLRRDAGSRRRRRRAAIWRRRQTSSTICATA